MPEKESTGIVQQRRESMEEFTIFFAEKSCAVKAVPLSTL